MANMAEKDTKFKDPNNIKIQRPKFKCIIGCANYIMILIFLPYLSNMPEWKWKLLSRVRLCDPIHGILQTRILEWIAIPFSRGPSQPRDQTQVSCIAGRFFTS